MLSTSRIDLPIIERRLCDIASEQLGIPRSEVRLESRLIEDLHCDSLDLIELVMALEDEFSVTIPNQPTNAVGKSIFTRQPFRLGDLAEIIYVQQGTGTPERTRWRKKIVEAAPLGEPFTQLSGRWQSFSGTSLMFEPLEAKQGQRQFRRRSDGMRCVLLPAAEVSIGGDGPEAHPDEQPVHNVRLSSFLLDAEPVSTTAFCRFLNSIEPTEEQLFDWVLLDESDDRTAHLPIELTEDGWRPVRGTETFPMVLVSWYGANAYSLWAHGAAWNQYRTCDGFLPSEAQWEYAAQDAFIAPAEPPEMATIVSGQHERGTRYEADTMRMLPVHSPLGISLFGLHHMAGNVWQWCRDWYDEGFYNRPDSRGTDPVNTQKTGVRSERGGSWVGPAELCRTSYRRGRSPDARGRCLGFRCISSVEWLPK